MSKKNVDEHPINVVALWGKGVDLWMGREEGEESQQAGRGLFYGLKEQVELFRAINQQA